MKFMRSGLLIAAASSAVPPSPLVYHAPRLLGGPLVIDGDLDKEEWAVAPWSSPFADIRGTDAPDGSEPSAACRTRMKMLWDDDFLYIAAILESDFEVAATFTQRNSPIFHSDSDFEVFIDASSTCHGYKELEMNARNVVWNLLLTRPYADGGGEHSGRIAQSGDDNYYEVAAQRTATRLLAGRLNDPAAGATWAVEIAMAHSDTVARQPTARPPAVGERWRINFSRVERRGEINWTWQPQIAWDARSRRYAGHVNMHLPDAWGLVHFSAAGDAHVGQAHGPQTEDEPLSGADSARQAAIHLYYAQHAALDMHGRFAASVDELHELALIDSKALADHLALSVALSGGDELVVGHAGPPAGEGACYGPRRFLVTAVDHASGTAVSVTNERLVSTRSI